ncbi:hypothetical protein MRB53_008939 [Persea americana]|uniref:Uncharacterized protein n=1 Tax=Persea americana TaxID=3435 RepID=A0ACC2LMP5_PERAE|nr:hypothetical protein MRB53_008939 [Persea americana]
MVKAFGWREVVQICGETPYKNGVIPDLTDALQEVDAIVPYRSVISHMMTDHQIGQELHKLETMQTRVFVVHLSPSLSTRLFFKADEIGMMSEGYVWIITYGLANLLDSMNSSVIQSMQGVLGVKPYYPISKELDIFTERWKMNFLNENPNSDRVELNIFGLWAYDTTWALAKAVEKVKQIRLGVSEMGPRLRDAILKTNFRGFVGGESLSVPKGWAMPTSGKKLKIGVPKKYGFTEFVNVRHDPQTKKPIVTGYSIDVFKATIKQLPYAVDYEFVPFEYGDGKQPRDYNELIDQVYFESFDAVVGDVTIVANRSRYVDFTLPYTESGVTLLVLANENKINKAWIFLKPLLWDAWLAIVAAFFFIGFVVWVFEHRVNDEFKGPLFHQVCVALCYSAFFTAQLTVQQLQPSVNDINDLIQNRENVGYQGAAFVGDLLRTLNVNESHLKAYASAKDFAEALSNGSVSAIFDEIPYLRLFLAKYGNCGKYKMVGPIYKTDGFGFVFPIQSPLVPDMSRAILNVTQGPTMKLIEKKWMVAESICSNQSTTDRSNSLTLDSLKGLFFITGAASSLAFVFFLSIFLYKNRHLLRDSCLSFLLRLKRIIRPSNERDLSHHHTARPSEGVELGIGHAEISLPNMEASNPNINGGTTVVKTEVDTHALHFQPLPLGQDPIARRRWHVLYIAWQFTSRFPAYKKTTEVKAEMN